MAFDPSKLIGETLTGDFTDMTLGRAPFVTEHIKAKVINYEPDVLTVDVTHGDGRSVTYKVHPLFADEPGYDLDTTPWAFEPQDHSYAIELDALV